MASGNKEYELAVKIGGKIESSFKNAMGKAGDGLKSLAKVAAAATAAAAIALAGLGTAAISAGIEYESAFAGVIKTVDATDEQLEALNQGIRDMAKEMPTAATEIAGVAEAAGQLGIETDNILGFTETMVMLGDATNMSAEDAATTLAKFANITGMSQENFSNLGSTIVALGNNYATTESDIANMAMNLASAGTQVGMSESDILALSAALSSVGLESQAGGTAFSKALINMQLAVETNSESLQDWANVAGMSTDQFATMFKEDATGALQAFIQGLSECGGETDSAIKVLDEMGITETRMRDALLRSAG
ncbi:MAG: phage tail tape measure protein, partial [Sporomusa sp.]